MARRNYEFEIGNDSRRPGAASEAQTLVVAGLSGDSGKTLVSLALLLALRERGIPVRAFKKGPDYIDAAWLSWGAGHPARNLDTWLAGFQAVRDSFAAHATTDGVNLVEGNRGLFDGVDPEGTHSTAELAKALVPELTWVDHVRSGRNGAEAPFYGPAHGQPNRAPGLGAPVLLVVDARKATRTLAACVLGCQTLDPALRFSGVVLNRVAGGRHESVARRAIEDACGVKVVGVIPRLDEGALPGRHLGLVPPEEHPDIARVRALAASVAADHLDVDAIVGPRQDRSSAPPCPAEWPTTRPAAHDATVAYLRDSAFNFYYPDNLEALEAAGAELVPVSSLSAAELPARIDALYIGGGFPETHGARLASNRPLLASIRRAAAEGLPIYAECGGLVLLARSVGYRGERHEMCGVLPFDVEVCDRPQGHGYARVVVDRPNPFFPLGATLKGHEFHYSRLAVAPGGTPGLADATACAVERGTGCGSGRDGLVVNNVWAGYVHLHASATPDWARGVVRAASRFKQR
jgi:cobyrinic acid a,c-diamide synthase